MGQIAALDTQKLTCAALSILGESESANNDRLAIDVFGGRRGQEHDTGCDLLGRHRRRQTTGWQGLAAVRFKVRTELPPDRV
jgi:hypothetical protein